MPAPLGRRFKDRSGEVATTVEGGRTRVSRVAWRTLGELGQTMLSVKLSRWIMLTVMVLVVTLAACEGYNLNAPEELDLMERQLRAPFNGMRGKRGPFSLNMYKKVTE